MPQMEPKSASATGAYQFVIDDPSKVTIVSDRGESRYRAERPELTQRRALRLPLDDAEIDENVIEKTVERLRRGLVSSFIGGHPTLFLPRHKFDEIVTPEVVFDIVCRLALSKDNELEALYQQARAQLSQERFFLNHSRLLKVFFQDLRNEAQNHTSDRFRKATYYLQSREREASTAPIKPTAENKILAPVEDATQRPPPIREAVADDDVESEESESEHGNEETNNQPDPSDEIKYLLGLFTEGPAFEAFKSGLRSFLNPPSTVTEAVSTNNPVVIRRYIRRHFDEMVTGDYPWVKELRDMDLTDDEIARILLDQAVDAPWIFFEPQEVDAETIDRDHHIPGCTIIGRLSALFKSYVVWQELSLSPGSERCGMVSSAFWEPSNKMLWSAKLRFCHQLKKTKISRYRSDCPELPGHSNDSAWQLLTSRRLCCNAFTLLHQSDDSEGVVTMKRVPFWSVQSFLASLVTMDSWEYDNLATERSISTLTLLGELSGILSPLISPGLPQGDTDGTEAALHYSALAVQVLCLAFLSYSQGHTGPVQPFFLDAPVEKITLCGIGGFFAGRYGTVEAQLKSLSCLGDMLGGPVLCFSRIEPRAPEKKVVDSSLRHDLCANVQDMIDTWGPGNLVLADKGPGILGVHLGGGVICADSGDDKAGAGDAPMLCHWSPYGLAAEGKSNPRPFSSGVLIRVASTVTENAQCVRDEGEWWSKSSSCEEFRDLGTHHAYWAQHERQVMGQGGQYIVVGANVVWNRVQACTLKQRKIEAADNELVPFLDDPFGVQVSFCTGVSRRVTLRKMLADLMPVFAKASIKPEEVAAWAVLRDTHKILNLLRDDTRKIKEWLIALPEANHRDYAMTLIRDILKILQHTGFNADTQLLNIAWPHESDLRKCFQIPCTDEGAWLRFFADSNDCVTFAYITTKCLETGSIKCRGSTTPWGNAVTVLETAVLCLSTPRLAVQLTNATKLEHKMVYFFRKSEGKFYVQAEQVLPAGPMKLVLCSAISPSKVQARVREMFHIRDKQPICLRERRAMEALMAEAVSPEEIPLLDPITITRSSLHFNTVKAHRDFPPTYSAVSYTWGDEEASKYI
ncbi:hypothetical protein B0T16DRAFT_491291 [Cercophora newfieldiana]|uniref:Uncharacterized protein n=1 Tax=Cercophora newfieldiana TaxID=92897 RepID=A0AA39Y9F9_9PEZI|nr:hypothetical protein B0T16DRAFT_491291 [Cercophora newfieldiana]